MTEIFSPKHGVKSVQIRSYFWSAFSCIQSEYSEKRTRNNSLFGHFSHRESNIALDNTSKYKVSLYLKLKHDPSF